MTDDNQDDDAERDWGEAERTAVMWDKIDEAFERINAKGKRPPITLAKLRAGTRMLVTVADLYDDEGELIDTAEVEMTLLDPATGRVSVQDDYDFRNPTEAVLTGSYDNGTFHPGDIVPFGTLAIEVGGKLIEPSGPTLTANRVTLTFPNGKSFRLWYSD